MLTQEESRRIGERREIVVYEVVGGRERADFIYNRNTKYVCEKDNRNVIIELFVVSFASSYQNEYSIINSTF